jgi:signal transduction histidine kinase
MAEAQCPLCRSDSRAVQEMSDAVLAIGVERSVEPVLQKIVDAARRLVGARYGAIGVPDGEGAFAKFITSGISRKQADAIGELPRTHGLLGAMLEDPTPFRVPDIKKDPRFQGWPDRHPRMRSFLGVPIVWRDQIIGTFYLTGRRGGSEFSEHDEHLVQRLAAHAAIAVENAKVHEQGRELAVMEERNRLARELHDSVTQTLFSAVFTAEAAATLVDRDSAKAREEIKKLQELARRAVDEMRSLVFELRSAELEADGLVPTLRKHVDVLARVYGVDIDLRIRGERRLKSMVEREVFRIVQEALGNALKHAGAAQVVVDIRMRDGVVQAMVGDEGSGFDPHDHQARGRHLGLTTMRERAESLGGTLVVRSGRGAGTTVSLEIPVGR